MYRLTRGRGPPLVLVHGSATDADGWTTQLATLTRDFEILVYDRRGTERSPLPPGRDSWSVEEHAQDLLDLLEPSARRTALPEGLARGERPLLGEGSEEDPPPLVVGSSFGAVCVLEAVRARPEAVRGMVLIEPPLPESDDAPSAPESFLEAFERLYIEEGGPAAAAFFLRTVLGKEAYEALPARWRERSIALHAAIRLDALALKGHRPRYRELSRLAVPTLLVGGGRSAPHFRAILRTLERTLPCARVEILPAAGHMLHAEAARRFAALLRAFDASLERPPL